MAGSVALAAFGAPAARAAALSSFTAFESGQVRPLALSPDGKRLFAVNTPDGTLEILHVGVKGLARVASVPVGLEPVAVAARTNGEVWVVNHLSDSVSIVDVNATPPRVIRTLLVGDEPRDIVFADPDGFDVPRKAFITAAHRGQNRPGDPELRTAGVSRADVWVFDANALGTTLGGTELAVLSLFGDTPRALAVSPDGRTVYAAVFQSGNQTTALNEALVCNGGAGAAPCTIGGLALPGGVPAPNANHQGVPAPEVGLIVKFDPVSLQWKDELGRNWSPAVRFSLPDEDVFAIDATTVTVVDQTPGTPRPNGIAHVGTVLFGLIVNPASGKLYVTNTEANNAVRFEGPGILGTTVRGHLHEARITVIDGANVLPRHLNKHIDYGVVPVPAGVKEKSLATPIGMAVNAAGTTLYVAAFGSAKIGIFSTAQLETNTFVPSAASQIVLTGGGPTGLVLDEARNRLYVMTRFDDTVSSIDLASRLEVSRVALHNPEPAKIVNGRRFLYDATLTSSNGEASCSSCHVFGDFDSLAWDLGNPDDDVAANPNPFPVVGTANPFHPMKGPMATQSLRGLANHGPMHWRGDRTGGHTTGGDPLDESAAFNAFNVAFDGLLGRDAGPLLPFEMQAFTDFMLEVSYPPSPIRNLDRTLTASQAQGRLSFLGQNPGVLAQIDLVATCDGCHGLDAAQGFFGGDGSSSFEGESQEFKVAHLRNAYQKIGMFGGLGSPSSAFTGEQVRGVGYLHDGSVDTVERFLNANVFIFPNAERRSEVVDFVLAFDSDLAPIVGQQVTLSSTNAATEGPRIDLLIQRSATPFTVLGSPAGVTECELVVAGSIGGEGKRWLRGSGGNFRPDKSGEAPLSDGALRALAVTPGQSLTYTCVSPGNGVRVALDRDGDGFVNRSDDCPAKSNPTQADGDGDGVGDACDSCPITASASQTDLDGDGAGNSCDADDDGDSLADGGDNCPWAFNPLQENRGGVGALAGPDAFGDACQCGDLNGDGKVTLPDSTLILRSLLNPPTATPLHPERCDVGGSKGCTTNDATLIRRALLNPPTATLLPQCGPASSS